MKRPHRALRWAVPALILAIAAIVAWFLVATRSPPPREEAARQPPLVEAQPTRRDSIRLDVEAQGTVVPAREVQLSPQVSGRIAWVSPDLVPGGIVERGKPLVRIEDQDYRLAVREAASAVQQARARLQQEQGQQAVAEREWELFREEVDSLRPGNGASPGLATREPQLRSARADVEAAEARLARARLELARTTLEAPFRSFVRGESAAVGRLAGPQTPVADLVGVDTFRVEAVLPVDRLENIAIPGFNAPEGEGSRAVIVQDIGGREVRRTGQVIGLQKALDPAGRMARLLVALPDPLGLGPGGGPAADTSAPVLVQAYVDVEIEGREARPLIEIPREAVREGDRVFVLTPEGTLSIREPEIVERRPGTVLVDSGLAQGERVILSPLAAPTEGMPLRVAGGAEPGTEPD